MRAWFIVGPDGKLVMDNNLFYASDDPEFLKRLYAYNQAYSNETFAWAYFEKQGYRCEQRSITL